MTSELRLAGNPAKIPGVGTSTPFGHFQIVYYLSEEEQYEIEVVGPNALRDWEYSSPNQEHKAGNSNEYAFARIDDGDPSADSLWKILTQVQEQFMTSDKEIPYVALGPHANNSNSYAKTLLSVIGVDIDDYAAAATPKAVTGLPGLDNFPGAGVNVLEDPRYAIALDLKGTEEDDTIHTGVRNDTLSGLAGNDKLSGDDGIDVLRGGADADTLDGGTGNDIYDYDSVEDSPNDFSRSDGIGFETPGPKSGDQIDLSDIDANVDVAGHQPFTFSGIMPTDPDGAATVWVADGFQENFGEITIVRASNDSNEAAELLIRVNDGTATAADWTADDFLLGIPGSGGEWLA